ncbi:circularly permuted type 2 ATP-grasp protein [Catellatospora tritici]|uniref:circularly permuted type 2 ATP-grasp protein n=1 Tax=Catellatospora tritici TaxID=2851566 RepID=UPI001C2D668F|nr:circularly permuted type 2 ATP-grasp protein [Catellatospora tritici]MBV1855003.1 circularly permuted type 2 ATP-grasp protein [Catellatospora tritici]
MATIAENGITQRFLHESRGAGRVASVRFADFPDFMTYGSDRNFNRPFFLDAAQHAQIRADLAAMFTLMCSLPDRLFGGNIRALADATDTPALQAEAILRTATADPVRIGRADLYQEQSGFRMLEYNLTSGLGGWHGTLLNRVMLHDDRLREFVAEEFLGYGDSLRGLVDTMLATSLPKDAPSRPFVAVTDWPTSFPIEEQRMHTMASLMGAMGVDAQACHMGQLEYRQGGVYLAGRRVDVIYRMYLLDHLLEGPQPTELLRPLLAAVETGAVGLCAPFDIELYGNKACMALLSDERHRGAFEPDELELVERMLPWTRQVRRERVRAGGEEVDLVDYVLANRRELILKPNCAYDGHGVTAGWTVDDQEWADLVKAALDGSYIVQRRVVPVRERVVDPTAPGGYTHAILNWGIFVGVSSGDAGAYVKGTTDHDAGVVSVDRGARFGCVFHAGQP